MRPFLHPRLINGRTGDPALYVETLFEARAILFDLGDIAALPPRKIHRLEHVLVSHTHIDHFVGFDQLLRILVGPVPGASEEDSLQSSVDAGLVTRKRDLQVEYVSQEPWLEPTQVRSSEWPSRWA